MKTKFEVFVVDDGTDINLMRDADIIDCVFSSTLKDKKTVKMARLIAKLLNEFNEKGGKV